jgi:phospholipase C
MAQDQTADPGGISRRTLLRAGAFSAVAAPAAAWHRGGQNTTPNLRQHLRQPDSLPDPRRPAGTDTIPQIEHIVVVMMENHSYDNHLGMLQRAGADGFRLGFNGKPTASNPYPDASSTVTRPRTGWPATPSTTTVGSTAS